MPNEPLRLHTERLDLVAGTAALGHAELRDRAKFAELLGAHVPLDWPPPLNDESTIAWFTDYLAANPDAVGWSVWYLLLREPGGGLTAIGSGGFKGKPDADGRVDIGYSVMPEHQRRGYATEATRALADWAFAHAAVTRIIGETLPSLPASIRVLEKCGFQFIGTGVGHEGEPDVMQFERRRPSPAATVATEEKQE